MAAAGTILPPKNLSAVFFAKNLFSAIKEADEVKGNFIVSPAAARSAMTLIFMAAAGKSADELRSGLILGPAKKLDIAKEHADSLADDCVCNKKGVAMRVVTRLFVKNNQELRDDFNITAEDFFNAAVDTLDFTNGEKALRQANRWLELQTFDTVHNLLSPTYFSPPSSVVLANSLYFSAKWAIPFREKYTLLDDFWINKKQRMQVNMMRKVGQFRYGESHKMKSQILQMPFKDSNISMLIIMPYDINGINRLEKKLKNFDLNEVAMRALRHEVDVSLPKFKIESDINLKEPLMKLGVTRIFESENADLSGLFVKKSPDEHISESHQKLFLDINEAGCGIKTVFRNQTVRALAPKNNPERKVFKADRPFLFAIRNNQTVYFVGRFVKP